MTIISERTKNLWYAVNAKYGCHKYTLAVNGLGQVVLKKEYIENLAVGTRNVDAMLRELLNK